MASTNAPIPARPASTLAKPVIARKGSASQPVLRKRVEPAIPLPYLQRRPKKPTASTQLPSPLRTSSEDPVPSPTKEKSLSQHDQGNVNSNEQNQTLDNLPAQAVEEKGSGVANHETVLDHQEPKPVSAGSATQGAVVSPLATGEVTPPETVPSATSSVSFPPPSMSPAPYNGVPPPFPPGETHPAHFRGPVPEPIRLPQMNFTHRAMHQHHPSNGSLVFGGFPGSNTPSPAPVSGGAFAPPVTMAREQMPVPGIDAFGRPMLPAAPNDGLVQLPMNHGPMTPHSFHDSQSSRTADENGTIVPFMNGHNGMDFTRPRPPPGIARVPHPPNNQPQFNAEGPEVVDAMMFTDRINTMFASPAFADCDICLVLPERLTSVNSQHPGQLNAPLRLPGHKLILSMSPILANLMQKQAEQQEALRRGLHEIRISSDDPYLRADSMWRAIKHVYGFRYVPMGKIAPDNSEIEQFHFVLGYAAAGALLEIPHISINAMGEASKLLSWDTVEKGVEFALRDSAIVLNRMDVPQGRLFPQFQYRHGIYVNELVERIMMFIITHFPNNFTLDTMVDDPRYTRLPPTSSARETKGPEMANNIRVPPQISSRKSMPRFGDLEPDEDSYGQVVSHQEPFEHAAALSRILLNLPFEMVKFLLESNSIGGVSGWQTAQDRRRALPHVIAARENRRLRFVSDFMAGRHEGPDPGAALRSQEPQLLEGVWNSVCWRERFVLNGDAPIIERVWEPFGDSR
ncbi:hypothetical protein J7T55_004328 [Diaporthe amygdali]|uniref:uncharacterized protein n=1 Tax=Phomopsis amygdali TaxID=1214568 RepID=UPI0022FE92C8|nr:uncharacterized protein J7T55_004328 [Diaporthe amygdali]KAJ0109778.1 hypothetical protein J7T55_004328 [Diaporthe amygdali]